MRPPRMRLAGGLAFVLIAGLALTDCAREPETGYGRTQPAEDLAPAFVLAVKEAGFSTPESVLHDPGADVYLVSNINGGAAEKDGNGFISRVSPAGEVLDLTWIDGSSPGVTLHAPKGMALVADTLFVTDIDCVRGFHRVTGQPMRELCLEEATFLNDLAATRAGNLYFSDSGSSESPGAVYLLRGTADVPQRVALADGSFLEGERLGGANGVFADGRGLFVATFDTGELFQVTQAGERVQLLSPSTMRLDGLVSLGDKGFLVSDWAHSAVHLIGPGGEVSLIAEGLDAPADMGFDAARNRVLIPLFRANELRILEIQ